MPLEFYAFEVSCPRTAQVTVTETDIHRDPVVVIFKKRLSAGRTVIVPERVVIHADC